jgi:transcriptional regulator with XRE-family HTH domain
MTVQEKLGARIKELRQQKGISQEKFAELADLDRTYISGIESGKRNISLEVISRIAGVFDISISELFIGI